MSMFQAAMSIECSIRRQFHRPGGYQITAEIVITYKVNDEGKLVALHTYWERDRAAATAHPVWGSASDHRQPRHTVSSRSMSAASSSGDSANSRR